MPLDKVKQHVLYTKTAMWYSFLDERSDHLDGRRKNTVLQKKDWLFTRGAWQAAVRKQADRKPVGDGQDPAHRG